MSKSASIVLICILSVLILFFGVFAFYPNAIEYGEYNEYRSPLFLIQKSKLFTDSEKSEYQVKLDEGADFSQVKSTINKRLAKAFGYYNVGISFDSATSTATFVIPKTNNPDASSAASVLNSVIQKGNVEIMKSDATSYSEGSVLLNKEHFKKARTQSYASGEYTVNVCEVNLTNEGLEAAKPLTSATSGTKLAIDGELSQNYSVFFNNGIIQIQSLASVDIIAAYINAGTLNASLILNSTEDVKVIGGLIYAIAFAVLVVASLIFFVVRYKTMGIAAILSQLISTVLFVIAAGFIHFEMFNLFAAIGVILSYLFMTAFTVWAFEYMRKGYVATGIYNIGTAFVVERISLKGNKKKALACGTPLLIAHAALLVLGIILWVIPTCVTAPLGNVFVYGAILSFISTFVLNRVFARMVDPLTESVNDAKSKK